MPIWLTYDPNLLSLVADLITIVGLDRLSQNIAANSKPEINVFATRYAFKVT